MTGIARTASGGTTLPQTFMWLGFIAAGLIMVIQGQEIASSASPTLTATTAHPAADAPVMTLPDEPSPEQETQLVPAHTGFTGILEGVVEPIFALEGTKLVVDLSDRQVYLYQDSALTATYEIAVGRSGWETPTGEFTVLNLQTDPVWQHPFTGEIVPAGAANPLGTRWIGFWSDGQHQIGLHGTNQEDLIGQAVSHGCIRLREADIQALYPHLVLGMPVVIRG